MRHPGRVIIIGGGIIGALAAYNLNEKGWQVTIIEKDHFGSGCSMGNCGLIIPSHVLPLNMPGAVKTGLKWMFKKDAPLYIKPMASFSMIKWFMRFSLHCNAKSMMHSAKARYEMLKDAIVSYETLIQKENIQCDWEKAGVLYVFRDEKHLQAHEPVDTLLKSFGAVSRRLDPDALFEFEPALSENMVGGWFYKDAGHLRPDFFMREIKEVLIKKGVQIQEETLLIKFKRDGKKAVSAITGTGEMPADAFVLTTGAWTSKFGKVIGRSLPIQPGKGYSVTMGHPKTHPSIPCMFEEARVVATPFKSGFRLGGTMEFSGYNSEINRSRINALYSGADTYLHSAHAEEIEEEWYGWRPMTYDGLPVIDRSPVLNNVIIAAGHNMLGISMAPCTGRLVAEILNDDSPHINISPYRIGRF